MTKLVSALALVLLLVSPDAALAHAPLMGIGGVTGGFLHAVLIPEHGMSLVALGLVMGRQERSARRSGELFFAAALVVGLIAVALNVEQTLATDVLINRNPWSAHCGSLDAAIPGLAFGLHCGRSPCS
jgi:hypothetical protein